MPRKLRIAVSMFFGLLTVALCVLWVRSAWRADWVWGEVYPSTYWQVGSQHGHLFAHLEERPGVLSNYKQNNSRPYYWSVKSRPREFYMRWGFERQKDQISIPHWFLMLSAMVVAALPWMFAIRRFSLRTLLIATTLVAVVLGLAVWAGR